MTAAAVVVYPALPVYAAARCPLCRHLCAIETVVRVSRGRRHLTAVCGHGWAQQRTRAGSWTNNGAVLR